MEMDTPKQPPNERTKRTRVRLASPRKQLERTIQQMTKLTETAMKQEKKVDLVTTLAGIQLRLLEMDREAMDLKKDALVEENERLKSELAARPTDEDIRVRLMLAKLDGTDSSSLQQLKGEVETLKLRSAKLQAENTELSTNNSALKSTNSELAEKMQKLRLENAELQLTIKTLESRTPQQMIDEWKSRLNRPEV
jgi:chromosome segregation ATPase